MQPRDVLAERAHLHKRVQVLIHCIGHIHHESYERGQRIIELEAALREAQKHIALLAEYGLIHKYLKEGSTACGIQARNLAECALMWQGTTCPACLETREQQGK